MNKPGVSMLVLLVFASASCATLLKGHTDDITVISEPAGAQVTVNGDEKGTTPVTFTVPSKDDLDVQIAKNGYQSQAINDPATTRWGWETFSFFSYVIPVFVDMGTGAAWGHDQLSLTTHLEPLAQASPAAAPTSAAKVSPAQSPVASASPAAAPSPQSIANASPSAQQSPASGSSIASVSSPSAAPSAVPAISSANASQRIATTSSAH